MPTAEKLEPEFLEPKPYLTKKDEILLIAFLACVNFTHIMDFVIMMPLGPQFFRVFHINTQQFSVMVSSYTFAAALSGLISSLFIDRFDRKRALLFLYAGFIVGTFLCALAPTYPLLVGARIVAGAFGGVAGGLVMAIVGDAIPSTRRGKAMGIVLAAFSVASVIGVPVGLYFATKFSWHAPFLGLAAMGVLLLLLGMRIMPPLRLHLTKEHQRPDPWIQIKEVVSEPNHIKAFCLTTAIMLSGFSVIPFLSAYMVANIGLREDQLPLIYLCGGGATFFTSQIIGRLADRFGKHRVFYLVAMASLVPILLVTNLKPAPLWLALSCTTLFMVLVSGRFVPAMALITGCTTAAHRGGFMSVNASVQQAAAGAAAALAGLFLVQKDNGPMLNFGLVGLIACGFTILSLWLANRIELKT